MSLETIYALSTLYGKSGVAVIRLSGSKVLSVIDKITDVDINNIKPRYVYYASIINKQTKQLLDKCIVIYFKSPNSFTGEDVLEIQCHGSKAVLNSVLNLLAEFENVRLAEKGEFSKRAFYNNKMDLTKAEGLADLIDAETFEQQKYALKQVEGNLSILYNSWRSELVKVLSYLEAYIDFPDEDIPQNLYDNILNTVFKIKKEILDHIKQSDFSQRLHSGFNVVIAGNTNAGKSSLINSLTQKNTVIVSDIKGTTRDAIDVNLDIKGYPVVLTDTAGIRDTDDEIEKQGVFIAKEKIKQADIIIALYDASNIDYNFDYLEDIKSNIIFVANKVDKISNDKIKEIENKNHILISAKNNINIDKLVSSILKIIQDNFSSDSNALITRERYKESLKECLINLDNFSLEKEIELSAEDIRMSCRFIGKITGIVEVDEILDNIFGTFCIGK